MRVERLFVCLCCFLLLEGCTLDDDTEFFPVSTQAYFLTQLRNGQSKRFFRVINDQVERDVASQWGISQPDVGDFDIEGGYLWISNIEAGRLLKIELETDVVQEDIGLGSFNAHHFQVGNTYIGMSDTLNRTLGFLDKKKLDLTLRPLDAQPGIIAYRSSKFYIQLADSLLTIFQEQSLSEIARGNAEGPIQSVQVDPSSASNFVYSGEESLMGFSINFNTDALTRVSLPDSVQKILHSTIDSPRFGKEISGRATLFRSGILQLNSLQRAGVSDVEVDFFDGQVYIITEGEVARVDIRTEEVSPLGILSGKFLRSGFYIDNIGN